MNIRYDTAKTISSFIAEVDDILLSCETNLFLSRFLYCH